MVALPQKTAPLAWMETLRGAHPLFLIVGLPRSRTAWLSAVFTDGLIACHHELMRDCANVYEFMPRIRATHAPIVGDSDSMIPMYYETLRPTLPAHKVAFILRKPWEAQAATEEFLRTECGTQPEPGRWERIESSFNNMRDQLPGSPAYAFEDLDDPEVMGALFAHCTGMPLNMERFKIFRDLKITVRARTAYSRWMPKKYVEMEA